MKSVKTLRDLQLFTILDECKEFKAASQLIGEEAASTLFDMVCMSRKNIAFQSIAMQLGLSTGQRASKAFRIGAKMLIQCKDLGIFQLKQNETAIWVRPILQFEDDERFLLDPMNFETHKKPDFLIPHDDVNREQGLILSRFSQHNRGLNLEFLNKINSVPFELDVDVLMNFSGKNMPITYNRVTAEYLNKPVYFRWRYDSRGRSYSEGYGINIQGNKTVRSVVNFKNKEVNRSIEPLHIMLANARGFDDWTWERRLDWAQKQEITESFIIPKGTKYPERYAKAMRALLNYQESTSCGVPMELDATASGIQIMAAITGCMTTGKQVNLVDADRRRDVYRAMARSMNTAIKGVTTRDEVKYPVMTHYYNSRALPKDVYDNPEVLRLFYNCLDGLLPGAEFCMKKLNNYWNPKAKYHAWKLPDGHNAFVRTMTQHEDSYTYNETTVPFQYYVNEGNKTDFRSLVPNIIHSIDGWIARQMFLRAEFEMVHVHDCFLFHPNHFEKVKQMYRELLAYLVTDYNINHIIQSLTGHWPGIDVDSKLAEHIMHSEYALS